MRAMLKTFVAVLVGAVLSLAFYGQEASAVLKGSGSVGGVQYVLCQSGIPFIKAPSGSMGNNGAITAMTALPGTYADGAYIWLPAGAVAAGVPAAGTWYWYVGSSTTAGTVYNSTYTSGCPAIGVTTAFATTGPGAFTGDTATVTGPTFTVPAMGINGRYEAEVAWTVNSTAGTKTMNARYGATSFMAPGITTQTADVTRGYIQNRGVQNRQVTAYTNNMSVGSGTSTSTPSTVNSAIAQTGDVLLLCSVATDFIVLESYAFRILN